MGLVTARIGHLVSNSVPLRTAGIAAVAGGGVLAAQYAWGEDFGTRQTEPSWQNHLVAGAGLLVGAGMWMGNAPAARIVPIIGGAALGAFLVAPMARRAIAE